MPKRLNHDQIKKGIVPDKIRVLKSMPLYFIPLFLLLAGLGAGLYLFLLHQDLEVLRSREIAKVGMKNELILVEIGTVLTDLLHLKDVHELVSSVNSGDDAQISYAQKVYVSFSNHKVVYDQVRYIDKKGMEIIRINSTQGQPDIVPKEQLQNKEDRYYFKETIKLPNNGVYISPFDLNVEGGKIEEPVKPMIRFGTPLYDKSGLNMGIVILNYKGQTLLDKITSAFLNVRQPFWLLNRQGYWLYSEDPEMNWGFMYPDKKDLTFQKKFPDEWKTISTKKEGQLQTERGLFTYKRVCPLIENVKKANLKSVRMGKDADIVDPANYYWTIVSYLPSSYLALRATPLRRVFASLILLFFIVSVVISWFYVRNKIVSELSNVIVEDIARLNESLMTTSSVISGRMDLKSTLKEALKSARRLCEAHYAALCISKNDNTINEFYYDGITKEKLASMGDKLPKGGLLKTVFAEKKALCLSDLSKHADSCGVPDGHPKMESFLGMPLVHEDEVLGGIYLTEKMNGRNFSEQDETIISKLADHIAAVIKKASMYEEIKLGASIFDNSIEGITITDTKGSIRKINQAFTQITGYAPEEVLGKNPRILKSDRHDREFYQAMWASITKTGKWEGEIWNRRKNGETYPEWLSISAIKNFEGKTENYVAVFHDISEVKATQERLHYQAHHDALTGLPNRLLFNDRLSVALAGAKRHESKLALLFLDLDNFKMVNDTLGHKAGDLLLQGVAKRLADNCRKEDTVARLGGDEFVILMPLMQESGRNAVRLAQRIIELMQAPYQLQENEVTTHTSIGIALFPDDGQTVEDLVKYADMAMYKAKKEGKNQYALFTDEINASILRRVSLESDLRQALRRNEFQLFYQPKINVETGFLCGTEALIRWKRNGNEMVPPDEFISVAEESGIITDIGTWVLRQACEHASLWRDKGYPELSVAVNLSPKQFTDDEFQNRVETALKETGLPPDLLTLEITENIMVLDVDTTIAKMERVSRLGVHWSMDDFGTGYSSIRYLQRLPLNEMKIDRSFLIGIPDNTANTKIVLSTVALAHSFGLKVVAEGVENMKQFRFLSTCRCNAAQGYMFSKPLPFEVFMEYLAQSAQDNWSAKVSAI